MTALSRIQCSWLGFQGAPGVSTFYSTGVTEPISDIATFFSTFEAVLPSQVRIVVPNQGDVIDDATGTLMGTWSTGTATTVQGAGSAIYAAPCGSMVHWITSGIVAGHRVSGRTYLVPLSGLAYAVDGTMVDATRAVIQGAADALVAATTTVLQIWSRPAAARTVGTTVHPARVGSSHSILGGQVPDKLAVLRSRRD